MLAAVAAAATAPASEYQETEDFADAITAVEAYADQYGPENTWLVVDIDNTLLAMQGDLGSDQWFEWQEYLLENEPDSPDLVAKDFPGLLEVQGLLFTLGGMQPPQENLPELIAGIQRQGVPTVVLTSRGAIFRPATERELAAAGYCFSKHTPAMHGIPEGEYFPYDPANPAAAGLSAEELDLYSLTNPKPVTFENGVFMGAGQHKGAMLLTVIEHAEHPPKAIVFVDDHGRHVSRVYAALGHRDIETTVVLYRREDDKVSRFRYCDKRDVTERWRVLEAALKQVFRLPAAETAKAPAKTPQLAH